LNSAATKAGKLLDKGRSELARDATKNDPNRKLSTTSLPHADSNNFFRVGIDIP
jgi:hypothetical protein